jgi:hypothetical protein
MPTIMETEHLSSAEIIENITYLARMTPNEQRFKLVLSPIQTQYFKDNGLTEDMRALGVELE